MTRTGTRIGIVGAGLMGRWHAHAASRAGAHVVAFADPDMAQARALARRHPRASVHESGQQLLAAEGVDVLHVCTPLATHRELAEAALANGVSVLVEKPLAIDLASTQELLALARKTGKLLAPVHQFPFQRGFRRARAGLASAGALRHIEMTLCSAGAVGRDLPELSDMVADILPHPLSIVHALLPTRGSSVEWQADGRGAGELRLHGRVDDVGIEILVSMASRPTENSLRMRCDRGTWELDLFHGFAVLLPGDVSRRRKLAMPFERAARLIGSAASNITYRALRRETAYPGLRTLIGEFHAAVRKEREAPISLQQIEEIASARDAIVAQLREVP